MKAKIFITIPIFCFTLAMQAQEYEQVPLVNEEHVWSYCDVLRVGFDKYDLLDPKNTCSVLMYEGHYYEPGLPPPPFNHIPKTVNSANIYIYDINGFQQKNIAIAERWKGATTLQASTLKAGIYFYTLICDGRPVDTKQMILTR